MEKLTATGTTLSVYSSVEYWTKCRWLHAVYNWLPVRGVERVNVQIVVCVVAGDWARPEARVAARHGSGPGRAGPGLGPVTGPLDRLC